ncbi:hypothetical protein B5C34_14690 [Pacificimonas flava]|uniref:PDZ domain-containing protein n=3 Tax=Pacificimonas TaxID=1960290 RepID=A0A219B099_9SPHN|nr:PDZ domain-containing protein [Pacificimonas aurantium]MBZ6379789.1 PDZ domain-containing protein [Pacificimonas aurantium]OWV31757.1 hypothetical protein B5C34_14690 [Pacificimonas flava]
MPAQDAPAPQVPVQAFPDGLLLVGISTDGGGAIVADTEGGQRYIRVGGRLAPGWSLTATDRYGATFRAEGEQAERRLALPAEPDGRASATAATESPSRDRLAAALELEMEAARGTTGGRGRRFLTDPPPLLARAGVREGDILLTVDQEPFDRSEDIADFIYLLNERESVPIEIERDGRRIELRVR